MLALRSLLTRCMKMPDKMLSNIYGKKSAQFVQTFAVHRKLLQLKRILCVGFLEVCKLLDEKTTAILHKRQFCTFLCLTDTIWQICL